MDRVGKIRTNALFIEKLAGIAALERDRIYCRHGMEHLLDVARIGMILVLEENQDIPADLVYAAALLHDIGRGDEYLRGVPHEKAGAETAGLILREAGYDEEEIAVIRAAVAGHRDASTAPDTGTCIDTGTSTDSKSDPGTNSDTDSNSGTDTGSGAETAVTLARIIRRADRLSRPCYACGAADTCKWPDEKKNLTLII